MTRVLTRGAMAAFLCLVLWGTLWDLAVLVTLLSRGPSAAAETLLGPPGKSVAAAWANRLSSFILSRLRLRPDLRSGS